jgi:DNA-binding response OmpR family regulator
MNTVPTVLVVEDDKGVRQGVTDALRFSGYNVLEACDGKQGMEMALRCHYNLLMLDIVMPFFSGIDILQKLRANRTGQPVIILSAKGQEEDRVKGLSMGADDYIVKPFSVREMLARVDAVLRRTTERQPEVHELCFEVGVADFDRREVRYEDGGREALSEREVDLLRYLSANSGRAVDRDEILRQVWGLNPKGITTRTIDMHVANLRNKLRDPNQNVLATVRGKGYMIRLHKAA